MKNKKLIIFVFLFQIISQSVLASTSLADVVVIAHPTQEEQFSEQSIRGLYIGSTKMRKVELVEQAEGQEARTEFYNKFLLKTETEMKQLRSIQIFSGEKSPFVLSDDNATYEYVKTHRNAIGYVSTPFFEKKRAAQNETAPKALFVIR